MAQETLKSLIAFILTLPLNEQEQVIVELQDNINLQKSAGNPTDKQKARLRQAFSDAKEGRVVSQEEAHRMIDEFVPEPYSVAV